MAAAIDRAGEDLKDLYFILSVAEDLEFAEEVEILKAKLAKVEKEGSGTSGNWNGCSWKDRRNWRKLPANKGTRKLPAAGEVEDE